MVSALDQEEEGQRVDHRTQKRRGRTKRRNKGLARASKYKFFVAPGDFVGFYKGLTRFHQSRDHQHGRNARV